MDVQKQKIALRARGVGMLEAGFTERQVAKTLNVGRSTVHRWSAKYKSGKSLEDAPRSGRPSKLHRVAKIVIAKAVGKRRQSTRKLARRLTAKGYPISKDAVHRHMKIG